MGLPAFPSALAMRAVSSPQTKAPAPVTISMSKEKPVSRMLFPRRPADARLGYRLARRSIARGYSART